jgi:hypothetical protein
MVRFSPSVKRYVPSEETKKEKPAKKAAKKAAKKKAAKTK